MLEHCKQVYTKVQDTFKNYNTAIVVMGTGLGKTSVGLECIKNLGGKALVVSPRKSINDAWLAKSSSIDAMTYQKLARVYKQIDYSKYTLIIFDEAHHLGAETWGTPMKWLVANYSKLKFLGLTESQFRYTDGGRDIAQEYFGGHVCYGDTVASGIEKGILNPVTYVSAFYSTDGLTRTPNFTETDQLYKRLDLAINNTPTIGEIFAKEMPAGPRKGIIFVSSIAEMKDAINIVKKHYPKSTIKPIHSRMAESKIESALEWFNNAEEGYLCSVNLISEGLHITGVNTLIMLRKTTSPSLFNQQLGRCLAAGRKDGAIVFDLVNNKDNIQITYSRTGHATVGPQCTLITALSKQCIIKDYTKNIVDVLEQIQDRLHHTWSENEDELLKKYYPTGGYLEVKKYLPEKTNNQIWSRANVLGLSSTTLKKWDETELNIMRTYYPMGGVAAVKPYLPDVTSDQIQHKAMTMKLHVLPEYRWKLQPGGWTDAEKQILQQYYMLEDWDQLCKRLPGRNIVQARTAAHRLGLAKLHKWTTDEQDALRSLCAQQLDPKDFYMQAQKLFPHLTKCQIQREALFLRLKMHNKSSIDKPRAEPVAWTDEEVEILKKYYPIEQHIEQRLPRHKRHNILSKASKLGLKKEYK